MPPQPHLIIDNERVRSCTSEEYVELHVHMHIVQDAGDTLALMCEKSMGAGKCMLCAGHTCFSPCVCVYVSVCERARDRLAVNHASASRNRSAPTRADNPPVFCSG